MKRMALVLTFLITLLAVAAPAAGIDLKSAQQQKSSVDSRISKITKDKKEALAQKAKLESQKENIASQQAAENNQYKQMLDQLSDMEADLKQIENALAEAENNYSQQSELLQTRLKVMYENSDTSMLESLMQAKNLVDLLEKLQYMSLISRNDNKVIDDLNQAKMDVEFKKRMRLDAEHQLQDKVNDKEAKLTELKSSRAEVEDKLTRSQQLLNKLNKQEDDLIAESNKLNSVIKSLSSKSKYAGGSMKWPCPGNYSVTSGFGMRKHPILRVYKMHTGIDIDADKGDSIIAANSGIVIISKYDSGGYGNMVVVDHGGGITTLYGHASKRLVSVGDRVKAGQVIAKVGSTGLSTGPHLHFEVRREGKPINPLSGYLKN